MEYLAKLLRVGLSVYEDLSSDHYHNCPRQSNAMRHVEWVPVARMAWLGIDRADKARVLFEYDFGMRRVEGFEKRDPRG